jgi:hypothetical protein
VDVVRHSRHTRRYAACPHFIGYFLQFRKFRRAVAQLAFGPSGASVQAIVIILQNLTNFSIGLGLHAGAQGMSRREQLVALMKLPSLPFAACAFSHFSYSDSNAAW